MLGELNDKPMAPPLLRAADATCLEAVERAAAQAVTDRAVPWSATGRSGRPSTLTIMSRSIGTSTRCPMRLVRKRVDVFVTRTGVQIFPSRRAGGHAMPEWPGKITGPRWANTCRRRTGAVAKTDAGLGGGGQGGQGRRAQPPRPMSERLLTGRDHIEQGVRSCLGTLRGVWRPVTSERTAGRPLACEQCRRGREFVRVLLSTCSRAGGHSSTPVAEDAGVGHSRQHSWPRLLPLTNRRRRSRNPATRTPDAPTNH